MKLHSPVGHGRTNKILVAAALANVQVELVDTQLNDKNIQVFLNKNPFGKVPVLETPEGNLFESNAILRHIARLSQGLYGSNAYQTGLVDSWLDATINELEVEVVTAVLQVLGYVPSNPTQYQNSVQTISYTLKIVNQQLTKHKYITGETLTVADIALAQVSSFAFTFLIGEEQRNTYPQLLAWINGVTSLPEWRQHFGRPRWVKTAFPVSQGDKKETQKETKQEKPKEAKQEKPKEPKQEKPKEAKQEKPKEAKQEKPKEQPKKEAKPAAEEDDEPKKKETNPLDLLPPSTFNIDDYKRIFFAEKDIQKNMETLFATIDLNGWSLWIVRYNKSENEGKQLILTNNLMKGFINQRLDQNFRKYALAIHGVYGDEPNLQLRGAWLWRGTEVPKEWKDHVAYDYHEFVKVDVNNAEQKQLFVDYWVKQEEDVSVVEGLTARSLMYFR